MVLIYYVLALSGLRPLQSHLNASSYAEASENKDAAFAFINYILDGKNHAWAAENILYKVPNKVAMESLSGDLIAQYPNMGMAPADLLAFEQMRDVGDAQRAYSRTVSEIKAAQ